MKYVLFLLLFAAEALGQLTGNAQLVLFPGAPSGSCTSRQMGLNQSSGSLYVCINSAWQVVAGAGGGNATGLNFNGTNIPLGTPAPSSGEFLQYDGTAIVGGTPAAGGLLGCSTATSGNLVCNNSVQGGTSNVGMLTLGYSSSGLPAVPSTDIAAIAADATGHLFWSPGGSTPFTAIGAGGGTAGTATAFQFGSVTFALSSVAPVGGECLVVNQGTVVGGPCGGGGAGGALGGVTIIE